MKCDFCFTETVTTESGGYQFCAYCRAVAPVVKRMSSSNVSFLAVEQIRALCALANVLELNLKPPVHIPTIWTGSPATEATWTMTTNAEPEEEKPKRGRGRPPKVKNQPPDLTAGEFNRGE